PWVRAAVGSSCDPRAADHHGHRANQNPELPPERWPAKEADLEPAALRIVHRVPAHDLPWTGHAGGEIESLALPERIGVRIEARRTRPDQAHVAAQHRPQLRELVDARLAQVAAESGHPRIVLEPEVRPGNRAPPA